MFVFIHVVFILMNSTFNAVILQREILTFPREFWLLSILKIHLMYRQL